MAEMPIEVATDRELLHEWIREGCTPDQVRERLSAAGHGEESIVSHLDAFSRLRNSGRRWKGFLCMSAGALTGFISCVLSLVNPIPELYWMYLYGLTSVAILLVMGGLYLVFE